MTYFDIMTDTMDMCQTDNILNESVRRSINRQRMYPAELALPHFSGTTTEYIVSCERSFEAARKYRGQHVAVLNFANCRSIGGNPYYANAQEECLCRCSTLLPCLQAMQKEYYDRHQRMFQAEEMDYMGNDDIIFTPDVVVFKTDEYSPILMPEKEWYQVDVVTCAAPELWIGAAPENYVAIITERLRRVLDIAIVRGSDVLILGAWGCGAYGNPPEIVAKVFKHLLSERSFALVEFAMGSDVGENYQIFNETFNPEVNLSKFYQHEHPNFMTTVYGPPPPKPVAVGYGPPPDLHPCVYGPPPMRNYDKPFVEKTKSSFKNKIALLVVIAVGAVIAVGMFIYNFFVAVELESAPCVYGPPPSEEMNNPSNSSNQIIDTRYDDRTQKNNTSGEKQTIK